MNIWYGGHLEHPKKCSGMDFWLLETTSTIRFSRSKKIFFSKFGGRQSTKIFFLACGTKKRFLGKILDDYVTPISEVWAHFENENIVKKSILTLLGPFLGVF